MTEEEWLGIGLQNGVVESCTDSMSFYEAYRMWFRMKFNSVKMQTLDRIECTYNRHYRGTRMEGRPLHGIDTAYLSNWLSEALLCCGQVTRKEYGRVYQIANNVLVYARDIHLRGARPIDWETVKRYLPARCIVTPGGSDKAVTDGTIGHLKHMVLDEKVYYRKQSACICLVANFYLGLRVGELAALRWCDVDYMDNVLHVRGTETKAFERDGSGERGDGMRYSVSSTTKTPCGVRDVPLTGVSLCLINVLKHHHVRMGYVDKCLAYDGVEGAPLCRSLDRTLRRLCGLCGVPPFSTHMIRKTFASRLHDAGVPTRMISDLLGHREISTTERYYILGYADEMERMRSAMDEVFRPDGAAISVV